MRAAVALAALVPALAAPALARADDAAPPPSIPRGTVTLTNTWTPSRPPGEHYRYSLGGLCRATLTYDGGELVRVDETLTWDERLVQTSDDGTVDELTTERHGSFHGAIPGNGSRLTFGSDPAGNPTYSFSITIPQGKMPVEERTGEHRTSPSSSGVDRVSTRTYYDQCWNEFTPVSVYGARRSFASVRGRTEKTYDVGDRRLHTVLEWNLRPSVPVPRTSCDGPIVYRGIVAILADPTSKPDERRDALERLALAIPGEQLEVGALKLGRAAWSAIAKSKVLSAGFARSIGPGLERATRAALCSGKATGKILQGALVRFNRWIGAATEQQFRAAFGHARRTFRVGRLGGKPLLRYVDAWDAATRTAYELKLGARTLNRATRRQVLLDCRLLRRPDVGAVVWVFFESPLTGKRGPDAALRAALRKCGIRIAVHAL